MGSRMMLEVGWTKERVVFSVTVCFALTWLVVED